MPTPEPEENLLSSSDESVLENKPKELVSDHEKRNSDDEKVDEAKEVDEEEEDDEDEEGEKDEGDL